MCRFVLCRVYRGVPLLSLKELLQAFKARGCCSASVIPMAALLDDGFVVIVSWWAVCCVLCVFACGAGAKR